jgi:type II secretory pathway component PulJ
MRCLKPGTSILELLIYMSLLGLVATLCFGLVLQVRKQNQNSLIAHTTLSTTQVALELLVRDIRASKNLELKRNHKLNLVCKNELGTVQWQLDQDGVLFRTDHQTKFKKPAVSKVAENIQTVAITQLNGFSNQKVTLKSSKSVKFVQIAINLDHNQTVFKKVTTLRKTMCI